MINEPASSLDDRIPDRRRIDQIEPYERPEHDALYNEIRAAVEVVLNIEGEDFSLDKQDQQRSTLFMLPANSRSLVKFTGRLLMPSETAYERLDMMFAQHDLLPVFRTENNRHAVYVIQGRVKPNAGGLWLSVILFALTIISVLYVGAIQAINEIIADNIFLGSRLAANFNENFLSEIWRGWPYALAILTILGAHELGHYFMARYHKTAASLPYFLPFPFGFFGTFGAAIRLREPMRNRKVLLDIGAAGPLAGLIFAIPILLIGLATSTIGPISGGYVEGNSVIYAVSKILVFGRFLPDGHVDVYVNQLAWAGWTGLLVTGLNLIPIGQLDGGHVLYSFFGTRAKQFFLPVMGILMFLTFFVADELLVFVLLIFLMGNNHATPLDDITPLDNRRRRLALFTLLVFFLVFVPAPLTEVSAEISRGRRLNGDAVMYYVPAVTMTLWLARDRILSWLKR